jgi:hypothetical protein
MGIKDGRYNAAVFIYTYICCRTLIPASTFLEKLCASDGIARCSQLTILLARKRALCSDESQTERRARGALSHVRSEAR